MTDNINPEEMQKYAGQYLAAVDGKVVVPGKIFTRGLRNLPRSILIRK
jgi:hypothetical protein